MAINLSTVSISLDRFDAVSDGEYNIGHIKLSKDGSDIARTNRHKAFEFINKVRAIIGGAKVISTDSTGKQVPNTRRHREQVLDETTEVSLLTEQGAVSCWRIAKKEMEHDTDEI